MREERGEEKVYAKNKYPHGKAGNALLYSQFVKGESINKMTEGGGGRKEDNKTNCLFSEGEGACLPTILDGGQINTEIKRNKQE
jgi:hypothetical protein